MTNFEGLLERLIKHQVEFVVVGGFAAIAHGGTLLTQDIDICCNFTPENLIRLQQAVVDLHPVHRMTPTRIPLSLAPESCHGLKNIYLETDYGQLDCLGSVKGLGPFVTVEEQSILVQLEAGPCRILSLEALIKAKEAMGRPRDKETVLQLRAIQENQSTEDA